MKSAYTIHPTSKNQVRQELLRVAAYCRVSTEHDVQDGSIEAQELHYDRVIFEHPDWENAGIYSDRCSGLSMNGRSEFLKMMQMCESDKIDLVLTKSISRFGRNTVDMLKALRIFHEHGVDVFFEKENLWLHEENMHLLMEAYCAFAQAESEEMSRSIRWGIRRGFERGTSGYADFTCYGYKRGDGGVLAIDKPDAAVVRMIFELRAAGKSLGAILIGYTGAGSRPHPAKGVGAGRQSASCSGTRNIPGVYYCRKRMCQMCSRANRRRIGANCRNI